MDRPVLSWKTYFTRLAFWLFFSLLMASGLFGGIGYSERNDGLLLAKDGIDTVGSVVGRDITTSRNNGRTSRTYYLLISYTDTRGVDHSTRKSVSRSEYETTPRGHHVPLRFSASSADTVEFSPGASLRNGYILLAIGAITAALSLVSLVVYLRGMAAMRRAASIGDKRLVPVVGHHKQGKRRSKYYRIEWQGIDGKMKKTKAVKKSRLPSIGSYIVIYTDPRSGRDYWDGEF